MDKNKKIIIGLTSAIVAILLAVVVLFLTGVIKISDKTENRAVDSTNQSNTQLQKTESSSLKQSEVEITEREFGSEDTFSIQTGYGAVEVMAYPEIKEVNYGLGNIADIKKIIYLKIKKTESADFSFYVKNLADQGNPLVGYDTVVLGCVSDSVISYNNNSDVTGFKDYQISKDDSVSILDATPEKPVRLKLEKFKLTNGSGAPACSSLISTVQVIR